MILPDRTSGGMPSGFAQFARVVQETIGVRLPVSKRLMVESRLRRRVLELGMPSVDDYFTHLFEEGALERELAAIFDAVTTNKTDFFREPQHFRLLSESLVASRLSRRRATSPTSMFKVWSAASSTGAEAYTIAMVLAERAAQRGDFTWGVLGTDINSRVLDQARRAIYSAEEVRPIPADIRTRFLMRGFGSLAGQWRVESGLRNRTRFERMNLIETAYPIDRNIDVIFLRNVLIYFDPKDQADVIERLVDHLSHQGHLIVGHSEGMIVRKPGLNQVAAGVYRKD